MTYCLKYLILTFCLIFACLNKAFSQTANEFDFDRIEDNSFLIEEAYNQEPGVIQHISAFQYLSKNSWYYTFTEECPVPGQRHQASITLPVLNNGQTGFGDLALNYRFQAVFTTRSAFSPRFSLLLPTGDYKKELGAGVPGYQLSLPFSYLLSRKIVTHYNLGVTLIPNSKKSDGTRSDLTTFNYGLSIIMLLHKNFNFMLEIAGNRSFSKINNEETIKSGSLFINPGFRFAINCKSGLQIVPGVGVPIGLSSSKGESGLFAYLSFEHPLWKP